MFGLFKTKDAAPNHDRMADQLCEIYVSFSNDMKEIYNEIGQYKPAEIHIFIISATSVMIQIQTQRGLSEYDMKNIVDKFTKTGLEHLLTYMPSADYELLYNVFSARFAEYADLVVSVFNPKPRGNWDVDSESASLLSVANVNIGVERDPFNLAMDALRLHALLMDLLDSVCKLFKF